MSKQLYIGDWHYRHKNILHLDNRPFTSIEAMDEALIANWNGAVQPEDTVYVLGDMFWCSELAAVSILRELNGRKVLVKGNHDTTKRAEFRAQFAQIADYLEVKDGDRNVVLCHYPIVCFKNHYYGWYHLYAHVHTSFEASIMEHDRWLLEELYGKKTQMFNVGVMQPWMGKNIIITSGPTNEQIDAVMKITNMSTGTLGAVIADAMINETPDGTISKIYYISPKLARKPYSNTNKIEFLTVESTQDLLDTLTNLLRSQHIDLVVHSAAVGDYKAAYTIRAEDLVREIWEAVQSQRISGPNGLMAIFENPKAVQNDATKISSYEPHLMTMMTLTPKVIGCIKKVSPDTKLVGFKLLEGVSREELFSVADRLRVKNQADFIVANDLSKIGNGKHWAMIVGADGVVAECETKDEIASAIIRLAL